MKKNQTKILLGTTGSFGKKNKDIYLDVELKGLFNELKPEKYDNDFDIQKEFATERNLSRNYVFYGTINSVIFPIDLEFEIWKELTPPTDLSLNFNIDYLESSNIFVLKNGTRIGFVDNIPTSVSKYGTGNIFGTPLLKYYKELNNFTAETIFLLFKEKKFSPKEGVNLIINNQLTRQQLIFKRRDPNGISTIIPFGSNVEEVNEDGTTFSVNNDFPFFYNTHWIKNNLNIILDEGAIDENSLNINDEPLPTSNYTNFSINSIYKTLLSFNIYPDFETNPTRVLNGNAVLRNGYKNAKNSQYNEFLTFDPNSFYPNDFFTLRIINKGEQITIPENNTLVNDIPITLFNNDYIDVQINNLYDTSSVSDPIHRLGLYLKGIDPNFDSINIDIDGIIYTGITSLESLIEKLNEDTSPKNYTYSQTWGFTNVNQGVHTGGSTTTSNGPGFYEVTTGGMGPIYNFIYFVSKLPGIPIIIRLLSEDYSISDQFQIFENNNMKFIGGPASIDVDFNPHIELNQLPIEFSLPANSLNRKMTQYEFKIMKDGYKTITIPSDNWTASTSDSKIFLNTGYSAIKIPYNFIANNCTTPSDDTKLVSSFAYINGVLLMYDSSVNNTSNDFIQFSTKLNTIPCSGNDVNSGNGLGGFKTSL